MRYVAPGYMWTKMCGYVGIWVGVLSVNESLHKIIVHAVEVWKPLCCIQNKVR